MKGLFHRLQVWVTLPLGVPPSALGAVPVPATPPAPTVTPNGAPSAAFSQAELECLCRAAQRRRSDARAARNEAVRLLKEDETHSRSAADIIETLTETRATTLDGIAAKARTALAFKPARPIGAYPEDKAGQDLAWDALQDLLLWMEKAR